MLLDVLILSIYLFIFVWLVVYVTKRLNNSSFQRVSERIEIAKECYFKTKTITYAEYSEQLSNAYKERDSYMHKSFAIAAALVSFGIIFYFFQIYLL